MVSAHLGLEQRMIASEVLLPPITLLSLIWLNSPQARHAGEGAAEAITTKVIKKSFAPGIKKSFAPKYNTNARLKVTLKWGGTKPAQVAYRVDTRPFPSPVPKKRMVKDRRRQTRLHPHYLPIWAHTTVIWAWWPDSVREFGHARINTTECVRSKL